MQVEIGTTNVNLQKSFILQNPIYSTVGSTSLNLQNSSSYRIPFIPHLQVVRLRITPIMGLRRDKFNCERLEGFFSTTIKISFNPVHQATVPSKRRTTKIYCSTPKVTASLRRVYGREKKIDRPAFDSSDLFSSWSSLLRNLHAKATLNSSGSQLAFNFDVHLNYAYCKYLPCTLQSVK